ncbi:MAG TPA: hypothetical protein VNZ49_15480 [Bacteroidia bacterium]|jgi:hypothetical protein|nr:hypothetical protein [Bacteroidia bacterium]
MKPNNYDEKGVLLNVEPEDIIMTKYGAIRKICAEDMPILSSTEIKRFATPKEQELYNIYAKNVAAKKETNYITDTKKQNNN